MSFNETYEQRDEIKTLIDEEPHDENTYVADKVLPTVSTAQISGDIPISGNQGKKLLDLSRSETGGFKRTETAKGKDNFTTREKGIEIPVPDIEKLQFIDIFDLEVDAARDSLQLLKLSTEHDVGKAVLNTTTFTGAANVHAITLDWLDPTAIMFSDVDTAAKLIKAKAGIPKSQLSLTLSADVFNSVIRSNEVRADVKYTSDINSESNKAQLAYLVAYLHIKEIILTEAIADTTPEGFNTPQYTELWNPDLSMLFKRSPASNTWRGSGLGRQPYWSKFSKDYKVESYASNEVAAQILRARSFRGEKIFSKFGVLLTNVHG